MKPTGAELIDKLATQGSCDQIALFLEQEGIKGQPKRFQYCAIAAYLKRETGRAVSVGSRGATLYDSMDVRDKPEYVQWDYPQIAKFINKFDDGAYPKLVR